MKRKLLVSSILMGLTVAALPLVSVHAQSAGDQAASSQSQTEKDKKKTEKLSTITVTGSLIPQSQIETASPVITITGDQMRTQGFRNVYDALRTLPLSTGSVQDSQSATFGSFTPGASTISLFGLDPAFTLILLNGHPMADYPFAYNGSQDFVDLSNIPMAIVDHIDVLSGGQSSLYGSSAVAGVVNIVLKRNMEGTNLSFRAGGYDNGGGGNERLQISGGHSWGKLDATYALSLENQDSITVRQSFDKSRLNNPFGPPYVNGRDFLLFNPFSGAYVDPGSSACDPLKGLFGGTTEYSYRHGHGYYCGSAYDESNGTLLNSSKSANGYLNLAYHLNENTDLYGEILYGYSNPKVNTGTSFWSFQNAALSQSANPYSGVYYDPNYGLIGIQRIIAPEEMGGAGVDTLTINTRQFNVNLGMRGSFGNSNWNYDAYYNRSQINADSKQLWPLTKPFQDWYLGQQQGTDPYGYGFPAFNTNLQHLYTPLTPAQFASMTDYIRSRSVSWQQNAHATVTNTDLFELPAGSVGFAGIAEIGNQAFNSPVDPRLIAGDFNNRTGTQGAGARKRYAVGGELQIPIFSKLTADASARYDSYHSSGRSDSKATYKLGLEYRPIDTLLLRANYATAFRAPDMYYLFQGNSGFYQGGVTDYYVCRLQGFNAGNLSDCNQAGETIFAFNHGSPNLKNITAKTFGYGVVWSPTSKLDFKVDYTHIAIDNEVTTQSIDTLLQNEANCRLGTSLGGQIYDINSPLCQDAISRVTRFPGNDPFVLAQNQLQYLTVNPINIASESLSGIQSSAEYKIDMGNYGNLGLSGQYYVELKHNYKQNPGDTPIDLLANNNSYEFKTRTSASVEWDVGAWKAAVFGTLYGKASNFAGTGTFGRWAQFNGSVEYNFSDNASLQFIVNNIANRRPPTDKSYAGGNYSAPPYYNVFSYNGFGRSYQLEFSFKF